MKKYIWINLISIFGFVVIFENSCIAQEAAEVPNQELSLGLSLGYGRGFQTKFDLDVCKNKLVGLGFGLKFMRINNIPSDYHGDYFENRRDPITSASIGWIFGLPISKKMKVKIKGAPSFNFYNIKKFTYSPNPLGHDYTYDVVRSTGFGINYEVEFFFKAAKSSGYSFGFNGNINNTQSYIAIQIIGIRFGNFNKFK